MRKCDGRHKIPSDFYRLVDGKRIWTCSNCKRDGEWKRTGGLSWDYYGTMECFGCGYAIVEAVRCPACVRPIGESEPKKKRTKRPEAHPHSWEI